MFLCFNIFMLKVYTQICMFFHLTWHNYMPRENTHFDQLFCFSENVLNLTRCFKIPIQNSLICLSLCIPLFPSERKQQLGASSWGLVPFSDSLHFTLFISSHFTVSSLLPSPLPSPWMPRTSNICQETGKNFVVQLWFNKT